MKIDIKKIQSDWLGFGCHVYHILGRPVDRLIVHFGVPTNSGYFSIYITLILFRSFFISFNFILLHLFNQMTQKTIIPSVFACFSVNRTKIRFFFKYFVTARKRSRSYMFCHIMPMRDRDYIFNRNQILRMF